MKNKQPIFSGILNTAQHNAQHVERGQSLNSDI